MDRWAPQSGHTTNVRRSHNLCETHVDLGVILSELFGVVNHLVGHDLAQVIKSMIHAVLKYLETTERWQIAEA
jgi:hypothetical protein